MTTDESGPGLDSHQAADNAGFLLCTYFLTEDPSIHRMDVDRQLERAELSSRQIWRCSTGMLSPCRSPEATTQTQPNPHAAAPDHHHLGLAPPARPRFLPPCFHSFPIRSPAGHQSQGRHQLPASGVRAVGLPPSSLQTKILLLRLPSTSPPLLIHTVRRSVRVCFMNRHSSLQPWLLADLFLLPELLADLLI